MTLQNFLSYDTEKKPFQVIKHKIERMPMETEEPELVS